ncbi:hypothetical protein NX025_10850 [Vibrio vulnificus]|nr:hypothetical protein [Vibrio vulnificus]MDT8804395.1 hypothetical protein [Vibrio vulnificus]
MLNQVKSAGYVFLCSLSGFVLCLSASGFQWALLSGHLFFGAGNSENCLNQVSGRHEVRAVGSIRNLILDFSFWLAKFKVWFSKL